MSLFAILHPQLDLTRDRSDGRCALTNTSPQYPTSDARHELFARPRPLSSSPSPRLPQSSPRSLDKLKNSKELVFAMYRAVQGEPLSPLYTSR